MACLQQIIAVDSNHLLLVYLDKWHSAGIGGPMRPWDPTPLISWKTKTNFIKRQTKKISKNK